MRLADLHLGQGDALFLDFDGTLAEIGPDPEAVVLDPATAGAILRLAGALGGAVAVISGRDLRDLVRRTPDGLWRAGGHGLEILAPGERPGPPPPTAADGVLAPLRAMTAWPGVRLELKGPVAALHYRLAPAAEAGCHAAAHAAAAAGSALVVQPGKMVVEVKPARASKGVALDTLARRPPFAGRRPVMLGDDATDEEAMHAALALGGTAVKIGPGPTIAPHRGDGPAEVRAWLLREAARDRS